MKLHAKHSTNISKYHPITKGKNYTAQASRIYLWYKRLVQLINTIYFISRLKKKNHMVITNVGKCL